MIRALLTLSGLLLATAMVLIPLALMLKQIP
jgi:hypothetical protein